MPNIVDKVNINGTSYDIKDSVSGYITGISAADVTNAMGYTPTSNTGTVTSVSLSGGTGISVTGSPITTSGTITISHSNSVTSQTTQAVYPIKIDAQGHVSAYGAAVSIPSTAADVGALPSTTTYVSSFNGQTGAVTYTAPVTSVNNKTGAVTLSAADVNAVAASAVGASSGAFPSRR